MSGQKNTFRYTAEARADLAVRSQKAQKPNTTKTYQTQRNHFQVTLGSRADTNTPNPNPTGVPILPTLPSPLHTLLLVAH